MGEILVHLDEGMFKVMNAGFSDEAEKTWSNGQGKSARI